MKNIIFDKKYVIYSFIRDSIELFFEDAKNNDLVVYNTIFTAWQMIYEMREKLAKDLKLNYANLKFGDEKTENPDFFSLWNYLRHTNKEDPHKIQGVENLEAMNAKIINLVIDDFKTLYPRLSDHINGYHSSIPVKYNEFNFEPLNKYQSWYSGELAKLV